MNTHAMWGKGKMGGKMYIEKTVTISLEFAWWISLPSSSLSAACLAYDHVRMEPSTLWKDSLMDSILHKYLLNGFINQTCSQDQE